MILCDIGNSNADFYQDGKVWHIPHKEVETLMPEENVYYICVNETLKALLAKKSQWINLEPYFVFETEYKGLGIDRIAACLSIKDGIVVDAGSAITVDVMEEGKHIGGYILPGLKAYEGCYKTISSRLDIAINPSISLDVLPQKTSDAISYGVIQSIIALLDFTCKDKRVFFTGGDGKFFSKFFTRGIFDRMLIFRSMLKVIETNRLDLK